MTRAVSDHIDLLEKTGVQLGALKSFVRLFISVYGEAEKLADLTPADRMEIETNFCTLLDGICVIDQQIEQAVRQAFQFDAPPEACPAAQ